jgi:plastocyanin
MADRRIRTRIIRAAIGAVAGAVLVGAGIALAADRSVAISGFSFSPSQITVAVGDRITWTNSDAQAHTATADDNSWDAGTVSGSGGTASVTFATAGVFPYHCAIHPTMTGTVTVTGGAPATDTDGAVIPAAEEQLGDGPLAEILIVGVAWAVGFAMVRRRFARGG